VILHVTTRDGWDAAVAAGRAYRHPSLDTEGFIHCSTEGQLPGTLARYFDTTAGHVALVIDPDRLPDPGALRWEVSTGGERFPHLYAPLALDAVVDVRPLD
jgi:uncharacterized protein (DUF952 family)